MAQVSVVGGGALGSMICARLALGGLRAKLVVRPGSAKALLARDLGGRVEVRLSGASAEAAKIDVDVCVRAEDAALVVLCTKVFDARDALRLALPNDAAAGKKVLVLCNGSLSLLGHPGAALVAGTTTHGCWERGPFDVVHAGVGRIWSADDDFVKVLDCAGLGAAKVQDSEMADRLWRKLAANAVLNPLTGLHGVVNGSALACADREASARRVVAEVAAVHNASRLRGARLPNAAHDAAHDAAPDAVLTARNDLCADELYGSVVECALENATNYSSMYQDVKNHRRTEIDALNGWVNDVGAKLGVETPENRRLADLVRARHPR
ncbi:ketopantoate reductase PanE/ApbA C terminal-domain-containing protein [Pelagophyceae sp. CCMP2097]|nr:ketopantoate reductase PanE/ApbA C terminal-domain-containing protein [Pelagophyceae sp. CCMP2097]